MGFIEPTFICSILFQILFNFHASACFFYWVASLKIIEKLDSKIFKKLFSYNFPVQFSSNFEPAGRPPINFVSNFVQFSRDSVLLFLGSLRSKLQKNWIEKFFKIHFLIIFLFNFLLILSPQGDHLFVQFVQICSISARRVRYLVASREIFQIFSNPSNPFFL